MTAMDMRSELVVFVSARLDDEKAIAQAAADDAGRIAGRANWSAELGTIVTDAEDIDWAITDLSVFSEDGRLARHIACHDPARVLRQVTAMQHVLFACNKLPDATALYILLSLAAIWQHHADYRQEWAADS